MRRATIVAPLRTPIGSFGGTLRAVPVGDLAATVIRAVVERAAIEPARIDDVVFAQAYANAETPCIGRWAALRAGLPVQVPQCGSMFSIFFTDTPVRDYATALKGDAKLFGRFFLFHECEPTALNQVLEFADRSHDLTIRLAWFLPRLKQLATMNWGTVFRT